MLDVARHFISIHAAREGGDGICLNVIPFVDISIHAAREGGDYHGFAPTQHGSNFNPRRP